MASAKVLLLTALVTTSAMAQEASELEIIGHRLGQASEIIRNCANAPGRDKFLANQEQFQSNIRAINHETAVKLADAIYSGTQSESMMFNRYANEYETVMYMYKRCGDPESLSRIVDFANESLMSAMMGISEVGNLYE